MSHPITIGTILGVVLGGLVIVGLAHGSSPSPAPSGTLAPLELSDFAGLEDGPSTSTDGGYRPVRPGSQRLNSQRARS